MCVKLVPLDALAKKSLFLHGLHRGALVHAHKAEIVQLTLINAAPLRQLMVGRYQKHQLILSVWHRLSQAHLNKSEPDQQGRPADICLPETPSSDGADLQANLHGCIISWTMTGRYSRDEHVQAVCEELSNTI